MRFLYSALIIIFLQSCSFDDKTGIWNNENRNKKENDTFKNFKKISISDKLFEETVILNKNFKFQISEAKKNKRWNESFFSSNNNLINFTYSDLNKIIFKGKKLTNKQINKSILYENNNLIINNQNGEIIVFSLNKKKIISKYNFYKKKFKNKKKILNLYVDNKIIYTSDNLGYVYAYNYEIKKILWAENYKIPFRSNIKLLDNKIILSDQNNNLYFLNKKDGTLLKSIPTEETIIKNQFINNLSISNDKTLYYLNSYGSLYSINTKSMKILWFVNINKSSSLNDSKLFYGSPIIIKNSSMIVSSNQNTYVIDIKSGAIKYNFKFSPVITPIINNNYVFMVTKNNLLISFDINSGKILFSFNVNKIVADYLKVKKRDLSFKYFVLLNNNIYIFFQNSYLLKFKINGEVSEIYKLPAKINSSPIFIDNSIFFLDLKNKPIIIN